MTRTWIGLALCLVLTGCGAILDQSPINSHVVVSIVNDTSLTVHG